LGWHSKFPFSIFASLIFFATKQINNKKAKKKENRETYVTYGSSKFHMKVKDYSDNMSKCIAAFFFSKYS
jgi:hypothetical protein